MARWLTLHRRAAASSSRLTPEEITNRGFASAFRGVSETEVRNFLRRVADEIVGAAGARGGPPAQVEELQEQLANPPPVTEQQLLDVARRGDRAGAAVRPGGGRGDPQAGRGAGRRRSCARRRRAPRGCARTREEHATTLRTEVRAAGQGARGAGRRREATRAARDARRARPRSSRARATSDSEAAREQARASPRPRDREGARRAGRALVDEARTVRERVLADLGRRRSLLQAQVDELRSGRDRLLDAYRVVKRTLVRRDRRARAGRGARQRRARRPAAAWSRSRRSRASSRCSSARPRARPRRCGGRREIDLEAEAVVGPRRRRGAASAEPTRVARRRGLRCRGRRPVRPAPGQPHRGARARRDRGRGRRPQARRRRARAGRRGADETEPEPSPRPTAPAAEADARAGGRGAEPEPEAAEPEPEVEPTEDGARAGADDRAPTATPRLPDPAERRSRRDDALAGRARRGPRPAHQGPGPAGQARAAGPAERAARPDPHASRARSRPSDGAPRRRRAGGRVGRGARRAARAPRTRRPARHRDRRRAAGRRTELPAELLDELAHVMVEPWRERLVAAIDGAGRRPRRDHPARSARATASTGARSSRTRSATRWPRPGPAGRTPRCPTARCCAGSRPRSAAAPTATTTRSSPRPAAEAFPTGQLFPPAHPGAGASSRSPSRATAQVVR